MQALKTIAEPALFSSVSEPIPVLRGSTAHVTGNGILYVAGPSTMTSFDIVANHNQANSLPLKERDKSFQGRFAITRALALLSSNNLLLAWGSTDADEPTLTTALAFWNVQTAAKLVEKVREVQVQLPFGGSVSSWACFDGDTHITVALAFADIHCSVQLFTFKKGEKGPHKPSRVDLIQVSTPQCTAYHQAHSLLHIYRFIRRIGSSRTLAEILVHIIHGIKGREGARCC
jgi:hypothetical protein